MGLVLVAAGIGINIKEKTAEPKVEFVKGEAISTVSIKKITEVVVDIGGEVIKPGVYRLPEGSRVDEVLVLAGGLAIEADREWVDKNINKAKVVKDGEKIYIPKKGEGLVLAATNGETGMVNINTADNGRLEGLPGIGPAMAKRIIDYRKANGGFKNINEIMLVPGIGEKTFENIKGLIEI